MSEAREIAKIRYASGEISKKELDIILNNLNDTKNRSHENSDENGWPWVLIGLVALVVYFGSKFYLNVVADEIVVANIKSPSYHGGPLSGQLFTKGKAGTVYIWVRNNDTIMCPKKTSLQTKTAFSFEFFCGDLSNGTFKVVADRDPTNDWIVMHAESL